MIINSLFYHLSYQQRFCSCLSCKPSAGTHIKVTDTDEIEQLEPSDTSQTVAIVGGGIGGLALSLSLQQRNIHAVVYERDMTVDQRRQGYGLTMQQRAKALKAMGYDV